MRRTQLHWLIVGLIPLLIINYFTWIGKLIAFSDINMSTAYVELHVSYFLLLLLPIVFSYITHNSDFEDSVAVICTLHFLLQFVLCFLVLIRAWSNIYLTVGCSVTLWFLFLFILSVNAVHAFKRACGRATKNEIATLTHCIQIIDELHDNNRLYKENSLINIRSQLNLVINQEIEIVHGYASAILQQCFELQQCLILGDENKANFHFAILEQLLVLWQSV